MIIRSSKHINSSELPENAKSTPLSPASWIKFQDDVKFGPLIRALADDIVWIQIYMLNGCPYCIYENWRRSDFPFPPKHAFSQYRPLIRSNCSLLLHVLFKNISMQTFLSVVMSWVNEIVFVICREHSARDIGVLLSSFTFILSWKSGQHEVTFFLLLVWSLV